MGYRNHLHVCQHCGVVQATASQVGPNRCIVCGERNFSEYVPANTVTLRLYSDFKRAVGERSVDVDIQTPATVRDVLEELVAAHPDLAQNVFGDDGGLAGGTHVIHNHEDVTAVDGVDTPVHTGDELALFTPHGTFDRPEERAQIG
ncbi:ubiquitin-like small modifier protein 1 [Halobaculum marinum]|uniref:Ubiquitin-like small modifier protein 1 n=1 Tax=Halobaculum marinum TaxID=3031996 RepID=A0ABD5WX67_9EURY|nr:ubiquitin-like small modifier protein 1 [Halobaculum sp. DT55]